MFDSVGDFLLEWLKRQIPNNLGKPENQTYF